MSDNNPLLSIVIPTRNRPSLLPQAIHAALAASGENAEVLILENSDLGHRIPQHGWPARVRFVNAPKALSMTENWERLHSNVRGSWVLLLSDKDRLTLTSVTKLLEVKNADNSADVIVFSKAVFVNGILTVPPVFSDAVTVDDGREWIIRWFSSGKYLDEAPMLYNSLVKRSLINHAVEMSGRLFWGACPDVSSSVHLCLSARRILRLRYSAAVAWSGDWGTGQSAMTGGVRHQAFLAELASDPYRSLGLVLGRESGIAETLLATQNGFRPLLDNLSIDWSHYCRATAYRIIESIVGKAQPRRMTFDESLRFVRWAYRNGFLIQSNGYMLKRVADPLVRRGRSLIPGGALLGRATGATSRPVFDEQGALALISKVEKAAVRD